jgi:transcriptional regulator with XRE-family HTH domain
MNSKLFSQRFNRELALIGFPEELNDKMKAIAKVFGVNQHMANSLIFGHVLPSIELLDKIASILEVCPQWLGGHTDKKRAYSRETEETI